MNCQAQCRQSVWDHMMGTYLGQRLIICYFCLVVCRALNLLFSGTENVMLMSVLTCCYYTSSLKRQGRAILFGFYLYSSKGYKCTLVQVWATFNHDWFKSWQQIKETSFKHVEGKTGEDGLKLRNRVLCVMRAVTCGFYPTETKVERVNPLMTCAVCLSGFPAAGRDESPKFRT